MRHRFTAYPPEKSGRGWHYFAHCTLWRFDPVKICSFSSLSRRLFVRLLLFVTWPRPVGRLGPTIRHWTGVNGSKLGLTVKIPVGAASTISVNPSFDWFGRRGRVVALAAVMVRLCRWQVEGHRNRTSRVPHARNRSTNHPIECPRIRATLPGPECDTRAVLNGSRLHHRRHLT